MDLGFVRAGFKVVWACDIMPDACATYRANIGPHVERRDLRQVDPSVLPECDVVFGGPPCQGYSVAGHMDPDDPRSSLTWEFARIVESLRPTAFVMENVKALAALTRWKLVRQRFVTRMEELGYEVVMHLLDARHYGVPQGRERVFFIGTQCPALPVRTVPRTSGRPVTAGEVLRRLPPAGIEPNIGVCRAQVVPAKHPILRRSPYAGMLFNGQGRPIDLSSTVNTLPASMGGNRTPIVDELALRSGEAPWVVEYHARLMAGGPPAERSPQRLRRITATEAAVLQTFPIEHRFVGKLSSQYTQIGNAVPPALAHEVALAVRLSLSGELVEKRPRRGQLALFS
jgi:DNA (cytosine-5)-methyltransferase 1